MTMRPDHDEQGPDATRMSGALFARRALLSALAGGGLTAVGLAGPLSGALAAEQSTGTPTTPETETSTQTTSTPTTTTPTSTTTGETATTPAPATTPTTTPEPTGTPAPSTAPTPATTPTSTDAAPQSPDAPRVIVQRAQQPTKGEVSNPTETKAATTPAPNTPNSSENVAQAPQLAAAQAEALAAMLASSAASIKALDFYRIPLFLLPIYQAAGVQYGVPWQILAAINEVETDYGSDLSVSTAGAIGWMQFMPETWLQYGVDAVDAGYADPYNPVDAIFAAARYLHAAGASKDLHAAILAYNHSEAYVETVLLRARLIASYPASVIATLTGLTEGSLPVKSAKLSAGSTIPQSLAPAPASASSATAGAASIAPTGSASDAHGKRPASALPGSKPAPSPAASAAAAERALNAAAPPSQLSELLGRKDAPVVAVEDGRIVGMGTSRKLGHYLVLRDTYGDVFTYSGLGSLAPGYRLSRPAQVQVPKGALAEGQAAGDPKPTEAASAGRQLPLTLHVAKRKAGAPATPKQSTSSTEGNGVAAPVGVGKVRVYAHPGNPDALAAAAARAARLKLTAPGWMKLQRGSVVAQGTVLGHLGSGSTLRFAIRPAGSQSAIDPRPVLENWKQLEVALHPQGAKDATVLAGATAGDAFLLSQEELQRAVLSDPDIKLDACDRTQVAAGKVQSRTLALLVFLSRSGLKPTVGRLRCGRTAYTAQGSVTSFYSGDSFEITAINDVPISGHQGAGTITDITIRTLLTVPRRFAPRRIVSLMRYPGTVSTLAAADHADNIEIELSKRAPAVASSTVAGAKTARTALAPGSSTASLPTNVELNSIEWQQLVGQIGGLPTPKLSRKPSSSAIRDKPASPGNSTR
jgi:membrane-bound lytic murein transglycosylase B